MRNTSKNYWNLKNRFLTGFIGFPPTIPWLLNFESSIGGSVEMGFRISWFNWVYFYCKLIRNTFKKYWNPKNRFMDSGILTTTNHHLINSFWDAKFNSTVRKTNPIGFIFSEKWWKTNLKTKGIWKHESCCATKPTRRYNVFGSTAKFKILH